MKVTDIVSRAFANVRRNKVRTLLTSLSVAVGAFTLAMTYGLSASVNNLVEDGLSSSVENVELYVSAAQPETEGGGIREFNDRQTTVYDEITGQLLSVELLELEEIEALDDIPNVISATPGYAVDLSYVRTDSDTAYTVSGADFSIANNSIQTGRFPADNANEVAISPGYVETYEGGEDSIIDSEMTIGYVDENGVQQETQATVVGIMKEQTGGPRGEDNGTLIASRQLMEEIYVAQNQNDPQFNKFYTATVVLDDARNEETVREAILAAGDFEITSLGDILEEITAVLDVITYGLLGFGFIALMAATFGIVNTQLMAVYERTKEIGLFKAMGMSNLSVRGIFSFEATWIGAIGASLGVLMGYGAQTLINTLWGDSLNGFDGVIISINPRDAIQIVIGLSLLSFLAGVLPARKAAKLDPITALRDE